MATPSEVAAAKAKAAQQAQALASAKAQAAAAQAKLATFGSPADINFAKTITPRFSALSELAGKISTKAANRPEVLKSQGLTLEQLREKTASVQTTAADYTTKVAGITQTEQELAAAQSLIGQYSTPVYIPEEDATSINLAEDAFINTLKLIMGTAEASKPYVKQLYTLVSKYYKTGSTIEEAINLSLYDAKENKLIPEFTNRFSGIFKLQERRAKGEAIDVPTIAEYIKSQERLGDVLRQSALGDLANETFLNTVMGTGKSVDESVSIITDVFDLIDNAPAVFKTQIAKTFPSVTRAQLAQALLTGTEGVKQLDRTVKKAGVIAAGTSQGLNISEALAGDLVSKGQTFGTAGAQFSRVAQILPVAQKLTSFETGITPEKAYTTEQAVSATFDQSASELQKLADLAERERARLSGSSGTAGSRSFASQNRGIGLI
jgi:hypothetical protein